MVRIPDGPFIRGTMVGGYDEQPERTIVLDAYVIDRFEVTNHQYQSFVAATGHRKAAPPSRYAKNLTAMRGVNQPAVYVSWDDADAYCRWKSKRLPTEAEWEKAMRGTDGRLWPWGNEPHLLAANWASANDGFAYTAPAGAFKRDVSPFGVADGAGNVMEWVADWYAEDAYRDPSDRNPRGPEHGTYKVLRGGGYTSTGKDIRITSRSRMVPDFRDETIGFRCAVLESKITVGETGNQQSKLTENQNSRGSETRPKGY
jgi:formylglycine-generating enzyme required for sulfatase activity